MPGDKHTSPTSKRGIKKSGLKWFNDVDSWIDQDIMGKRKHSGRRRR
jgi:hypothetical protein